MHFLNQFCWYVLPRGSLPSENISTLKASCSKKRGRFIKSPKQASPSPFSHYSAINPGCTKSLRGSKKRETERQRDRETERQRDRETERQRDRETERQRDRETERQRDRETSIEQVSQLLNDQV